MLLEWRDIYIPKTRKEVFFETQLPEDMVLLREKWEAYINYNRPKEEEEADKDTINDSKHDVSNLR